MPRVARVIENNVCFHIIARGNQNQTVFKKDSDYQFFLKILRKYKWHYGYKLYGYCLMPNHIHLLLEIDPAENISELMKSVNQSYAIYFNSKYNTSGHLWQGRFKSMLITKDDYLLNCIQYIEFNPLRAKIVRNAEKYQWSSYKSRVLGLKDRILNKLENI